MKPSLRLWILLISTVAVIVSSRVNLLIVSIPMPSKMHVTVTSQKTVALFWTYATPMMLEIEIAPMVTPVKHAKTKLQKANSQDV